MASGTFTGARGGTSTGPYLTLHWSELQQDIAGNRTQVRLTLKLVSDYNISFSATKYGVLHGTSFSYSNGMSGAGTITLKTLDVWVSHNDDGSKSQSFSGTFDIKISWSGVWVETLSVSGTATLTPIPRSSDFTAFSLANSVLAVSTATTINYTTDKKSSTFTDHLTLKYGNTTIATWSTTSEGALTRTLSATEVNSIINAMPTVTSGTLTLYLQTKDGTTNVGSSKSRTTSISLNTNIAPTASSLVASIFGSGRDKTIGKYVQSISKVTSSFTAGAGYGATISTTNITVKRQSDNGNSQTISGTSGTTANAVSLSGTYIITAYVKDSRGREKTLSITITVEAYSVPKINTFTTVRNSTTSTTVNATIDVTWSLGASNPTDITVVGVNNVGTSVTLRNTLDSTTGSLSVTDSYASQSDASSYTYTLTVTDSFGNSAPAKATVSTSFVEATIAKGKGVGIGKVHENGTLDVGGDVFLNGKRLDMVRGDTGSINSVGTITFDWTAGSYDHAANHSITSKDSTGAWSDDLRINSYGDVIIDIDSNNNSTSSFIISKHGNGVQGTHIFTVDENGNITAGDLNVKRILMGDSSRIVGGGTGTGNSAWFGFYESNGTTRQGWVGAGSTANTDMHLSADVGNIRLIAGNGSFLMDRNGNVGINGLFTNEGYIQPSMENGWVDYGLWEGARYWKDKNHVVHITGLIKNGTTTNGTTIFTLPTGYRPNNHYMYACLNANYGVSRVDVYDDGRVVINSGGSANASFLSLAGITFRAV